MTIAITSSREGTYLEHMLRRVGDLQLPWTRRDAQLVRRIEPNSTAWPIMPVRLIFASVTFPNSHSGFFLIPSRSYETVSIAWGRSLKSTTASSRRRKPFAWRRKKTFARE